MSLLLPVVLAIALSSPSRPDDPWWPPTVIGFGTAVAVSGDEVLVARTETATGWSFNPARTGGIHVYRRESSGGWVETAVLGAADLSLGDQFGAALATEGALMAVAAPRHAGGTVYLFERSAGRWSSSGTLTVPGTTPEDQFGQTLALENGVLLVGAPGRDSARGEVFAFRRDPRTGVWSPAERVGAGEEPGSGFGAALALAGGRALVGAPGSASPTGRRAGYAAIYRRDERAWTETRRLRPPNDSSDGFGFAVHLAGGSALVSAPGSNAGRGAVHVFDAGGEGSGTLATAELTPGAAFGYRMAGERGALFVAAPLTARQQGAIHVFTSGARGWMETQRLTPPAGRSAVGFGAAVASGGDVLVIGGPLADFWEGTGWVFRRHGSGSWGDPTALMDSRPPLPAVTGGEKRCENGAVGDFPCAEVDLLAFLPLPAIGGERGVMLNDIWGWTDLETGREYALVGRVDGTSFVDVTDPANPVYVGNLPLHTGARPNRWRDIKVYRNHAFIVADNGGPHGVQVFDLTRLRRVAQPPVTFTETAHYDRLAESHNIAINEESGFAYAVGSGGGGESCAGGLHMIDVRDPIRPTFAGCFADPAVGNRTGSVHDTQCVTYRGPDARYRGRELCFNAAETALHIADVTDKRNPRTVAIAEYPNTSYTHQGWLTEDQRHFFLGDEGDELDGVVPRTRTLAWDVSNLEEPVLLGEFLGTNAATDHNLYIRGRYMYQSNYVSGLRVIDISDPGRPRETGYFDSVPWGENSPGFAGSWSNYPFFKSGTIVFTSRKEGLFVVRHRPAELIP